MHGLACSAGVFSSSSLEGSNVGGTLVLLKSSVSLASKDVGADTMSCSAEIFSSSSLEVSDVGGKSSSLSLVSKVEDSDTMPKMRDFREDGVRAMVVSRGKSVSIDDSWYVSTIEVDVFSSPLFPSSSPTSSSSN